MADSKPAKKGAQKSAKRTTANDNQRKRFTTEEQAAMRERAQELKARPRAGKADGESAVLAAIAAMPAPDRVIAERLHAIINASAPVLSPKTWYGMPAYANDDRSSASSKARRSSRRGTRHSASATRRTSTKATCGRPPSR
jgi:uncharacterized protein YdhG (YjbR/CyaY superfamily)